MMRNLKLHFQRGGGGGEAIAPAVQLEINMSESNSFTAEIIWRKTELK